MHLGPIPLLKVHLHINNVNSLLTPSQFSL